VLSFLTVVLQSLGHLHWSAVGNTAVRDVVELCVIVLLLLLTINYYYY